MTSKAQRSFVVVSFRHDAPPFAGTAHRKAQIFPGINAAIKRERPARTGQWRKSYPTRRRRKRLFNGQVAIILTSFLILSGRKSELREWRVFVGGLFSCRKKKMQVFFWSDDEVFSVNPAERSDTNHLGKHMAVSWRAGAS